MGSLLRESIESSGEEAKRLLSIPRDAVADWDPLAGLYRTKPSNLNDRKVEGIVRIHTNFPHHKLGVLQLLNLAPSTVEWDDVEARNECSGG